MRTPVSGRSPAADAANQPTLAKKKTDLLRADLTDSPDTVADLSSPSSHAGPVVQLADAGTAAVVSDAAAPATGGAVVTGGGGMLAGLGAYGWVGLAYVPVWGAAVGHVRHAGEADAPREPVAQNLEIAVSEDQAGIAGQLIARDANRDVLTFRLLDDAPSGVHLNPDGTFTVQVPASDQSLDDGESRQVTFRFVANDGHADSAPATVTVTINGANDAPVAQALSLGGGEDDAAIAGSVAATDADGEALTYALVGEAPAGVTFRADGTFSVAPLAADQALDDGESRVVTFQYVANDGSAASDPATVTVTINGANDAPVAQALSFGGGEDDAAIAGSVAATDADGEALTYALVGEAPAGVTFRADGTFSVATFAADQMLHEGESRVVTFRYFANDGSTDSAPATVTVAVNGANDVPVVGSLVINLTENGGPYAVDLPQAFDAENDPFSYYAPEGSPDYLTLAFGQVYLDFRLFETYQYLDDGQSVSLSFGYVVADPFGHSAPATFTLNIQGSNDAPYAVEDELHVSYAPRMTVDVLANDVDAEGGPLSIVDAHVVVGTAGVEINADGTLSISGVPFADMVLVQYTVADVHGVRSAPVSAVITVDPLPGNHDPVGIEGYFIDGLYYDQTYILGIPAYDPDGDPLTLLEAHVSAGTGSAGLENGELVFNPGGLGGASEITYTVVDGQGGVLTSTFLAVATGNYAPVAFNDDLFTDSLTTVTGNVLANDTDQEGQALSVSGYSLLSGYGYLEISSEGLLTYNPFGYTGEAVVAYTVDDGYGGMSAANVTITIVPHVNLDPLAADDYLVTDYLTGVSLNVLENDTDPEGDPLSIVSYSWGGIGYVDIGAGDGTIYFSPNGAQGDAWVSYTVDDGQGGQDTATLWISVSGPNGGGENLSPLAQDDNAVYDSPASVLEIQPLLNDSDPDADPVTIVDARVVAGGGSVMIGTSGQLLNVDDILVYYADGYLGNVSIAYTIDDGRGGQSTAMVYLSPASGNQAPAAFDDSYGVLGNPDQVFDVLANDYDPDGDVLTLAGAYLAEGYGSLSIEPDGRLAYHAAGYTGNVTVVYTADDGRGGQAQASLYFSISPETPNLAPDAVDDQLTANLATPAWLNVLANDSDPDGDALAIVDWYYDGTGFADLDTLTGVLYFSPFNSVGGGALVYTVSDGRGGYDTARVDISVTSVPGVNSSPSALPDFGGYSYGEPVRFNVLGNDSDPDGDVLSVLSASVVYGGGLASVNPDGSLTYTPQGYLGTVGIMYTISDGHGGQAIGSASVYVMYSGNSAPVVTGESGFTVQSNAVLSVNVLANDYDPDGDPIRLDGLYVSSGGGAVTTNENGTVIYDPQGYVGSVTIHYLVADNRGGLGQADLFLTSVRPDAVPDLVGDDNDNWLFGSSGNDVIEGRGGRDNLHGAKGSDTMSGGEGDDWMSGSSNGLPVSVEDNAMDLLYGDAGNDQLDGGGGGDMLSGGADVDRLYGAAGDDLLMGGTGNDYLVGGGGDDLYLFQAGDGMDIIDQGGTGGLAGPGLDAVMFYGVDRDHAVIGRNGADLVVSLLDDAGTPTGDRVTVLSHFQDGAADGYGSLAISELVFDDQTISDFSVLDAEYGPALSDLTRDDVLTGTAGSDMLIGGFGNDRLDGGAGNDLLSGGPGDDMVVYRYGLDGRDLVFNPPADAVGTDTGTDVFAIHHVPALPGDRIISLQLENPSDLNPDLFIQIGDNPREGLLVEDFFTLDTGSGMLGVSDAFADDIFVLFSDEGTTELLRLTGQQVFDTGGGLI
ncbi:MAG TPA: Ig-like domain-containing protein [Fluviicoccus sp.]|nr:Ig-like domain-containing protein [Fluviicoccus sp.]